MPSRRRLTLDERRAIVREAAKGVAAKELAAKHGITTRTVHYTLKRETDRRRDASHRSVTFSVTLTPEEAMAFDAVLTRHQIATRADGLRRLIRASNGVFQPDEHLAEELQGFRASLNRVGNNITQIAKRLNEAKQKGIAPAFGVASLDQIKGLAMFIRSFANEIDLLAQRRSKRMTLAANAALEELADGAD
ncbi:helix-turn-helix domain-containing protein [Jannaschia rubra]|uniref:Bacterial mobilisation protein (MobC) n=1 Tax=Jannaschia rubra TaxID=282197 RepID=A0A0M6XWI7_9RHOB|nr:helix-turn-helix domain-containing protein [Jannaschia rubra]CTQ34455.1 hypothetical protein JAN5088_03251 [Jannaschia rubra]